MLPSPSSTTYNITHVNKVPEGEDRGKMATSEDPHCEDTKTPIPGWSCMGKGTGRESGPTPGSVNLGSPSAPGLHCSPS